MPASIDYFDLYFKIIENVQLLFGFCFLVRLLHRKVKFYMYLLFTACGSVVLYVLPPDTILELGAFALLLIASGVLICHADWNSSILYAALVVEIMQLCYGIVKSLLSIFYPMTSAFDQTMIGIVFMLSGDAASLFLTWFFCFITWKYFSSYESIEKHSLFLVFIPVLMIFFMDEYINSFIYGMVVTDRSGITVYINHYQMLLIQIFGMASLFCILYAYKKLSQNFRLSAKLSLLEQEEHSLYQYVDEAKTHYEKTKSFRHDIKNHIAVIKKLLQSGKHGQALEYLVDLEDMSEELSFPCSVNNPVVDILVGNKLGIAKGMGIDVCCSLLLPYPCGLRDIDLCIILSNALDNAIHACKNMSEEADKYIHLTGRVQGDFLFMEIENSFQGKEPLKKGIGLSNVKAVAEKYHGAMRIKTQGTVFTLNVLLIIPPQHSENLFRHLDKLSK